MDEVIARAFERNWAADRKSPPGAMYAESDRSDWGPGLPTDEDCPGCGTEARFAWEEGADEEALVCMACDWTGTSAEAAAASTPDPES